MKREKSIFLNRIGQVINLYIVFYHYEIHQNQINIMLQNY